MIDSPLLRDIQKSVASWVIITILFAIAASTGIAIAAGVLEVKQLITIFAGLVVISLILSGSDSTMRAAYFLAVVTFAVGHRSLYIGRTTFFVPAELIAWALFGAVLTRIALQHGQIKLELPRILLFFVIWCILSLLWTQNALQGWEDVVSRLKLWVIALPVFIATATFVTEPVHLRRVFRILILVAVYMSILGIVEYTLPTITARFPWFFNLHLATLDSAGGFVRSYFSFWGNPIGVIIIGWGILAAIEELLHGGETVWRIIAIGTLPVGMVAVYIAGQRATWISLTMGIAVLALLSGRRGWGILAVFVGGLALLPTQFWQRLETVLPSSTYFLVDSSLLWRVNSYQMAIEQIQQSPILGIGLGGGLTHNEFLAFALHLGIPGMVAFIVLLGQIFIGLYRSYSQSASPELYRFSRLFLALYATWLVDLSFHPAMSVPPVTVPYWFILALAWYLPHIFRKNHWAPTVLSQS